MHLGGGPPCLSGQTQLPDRGALGPPSQIWLFGVWQLLGCGVTELRFREWGGGRGTAPLSAEGAKPPLYVSPCSDKAGSWVHKSLQMALSDEAISIIMVSRQKAGSGCGLGAPPLLYSACGTGLTPVCVLHCASAPILCLCQVYVLSVWNSAAFCPEWCCQGDARRSSEINLHCSFEVFCLLSKLLTV